METVWWWFDFWVLNLFLLHNCIFIYGVNTSQEGDKCCWRGREDCGRWRNECSERSVPGMKWKVAECSGKNGWTACNAGCWCGCVNEWIGMECWGTKHGMEMTKRTYRQRSTCKSINYLFSFFCTTAGWWGISVVFRGSGVGLRVDLVRLLYIMSA